MRGERTVIIRSPTSFLAETREKSRRNFGRGRGKKKKQKKRKEKGDEEARFIDHIRRERGNERVVYLRGEVRCIEQFPRKGISGVISAS